MGGLIGGYITEAIGWRWTMYLSAIMSGALLVLIIFFVPETMFERERALSPARFGGIDQHQAEEKVTSRHAERDSSEGGASETGARSYVPFTFARSLQFRKPTSSLWRNFYTPYLALRFPGTVMVMLQYAGLVGLVVSISTVAPNLLAAPPYLWGANVGLINVGGLIGTALGAIYTYFTTDWLTKRAAKKESHGFAEPETRLPLMFLPLTVATAGSLAFGFSAQSAQPLSWVGLEFGSVRAAHLDPGPSTLLTLNRAWSHSV